MRALALLALAVICAAPAAVAQTASGSGASVCIYSNRSYSAGAAICPQARFMLTCAQENDKLVWKIVADQALANRCLAPSVTADTPARRRHARVRPVRTAARAPAPTPSAKCFVFNNKQYCE